MVVEGHLPFNGNGQGAMMSDIQSPRIRKICAKANKLMEFDEHGTPQYQLNHNLKGTSEWDDRQAELERLAKRLIPLLTKGKKDE